MANGISPITTNFGPTVDQSSSTISKRNIFESYERIDTTKKTIQVVGKTGSGKSTLVNYLIGNLDKEATADGIYVNIKKDIGPEIGHTLSSKTIFSEMYKIPCNNAELYVQDNGGFFDVRDVELIKQSITLSTAETYLSTLVKGTILMINEGDLNVSCRASQFEQTLKELLKISHLSDRTEAISKHLCFIITPNKNDWDEPEPLTEARINSIKVEFLNKRDQYLNRLKNDAIVINLTQHQIGDRQLDETLIKRLGLNKFFLEYKEINFENYDNLFNQFYNQKRFDAVIRSLGINHNTFKHQLKKLMDDFKDIPFILPNRSFHEVLLNISAHNLFVADYENEELRDCLIKRYSQNEPLETSTTEQVEKTLSHNDIHIFANTLRDDFADSKNIFDFFNNEFNKIITLINDIDLLKQLKQNSININERISEIMGGDTINTNVLESKKTIKTLEFEISNIKEKLKKVGYNRPNHYTFLNHYDGSEKKVNYFPYREGIIGGFGRIWDAVAYNSQFLGAGNIGIPRQSLRINARASSDNNEAKIEYWTNVYPRGHKTGFIRTNEGHSPNQKNIFGQLCINELYTPLRFTTEPQGVCITAKIKTMDNGRNRTIIKESETKIKSKEELISIKQESIKTLRTNLSNQNIDEKIQSTKTDILTRIRNLFSNKDDLLNLKNKLNDIQQNLDILTQINNLMAVEFLKLFPLLITKQGIDTFLMNGDNSLQKTKETLHDYVKSDGIILNTLNKINCFQSDEIEEITQNLTTLLGMFITNEEYS